MAYDSKLATMQHIKRVNELMIRAAAEILRRANAHDESKLKEPEKSLFDIFTPLLAGTTYGSEDYKKHLKGLAPALAHHYKHNSHHPEHYANGISGFDVFDLLEMIFDWLAASERHDDGNIYESLKINKKRFKLGGQISSIIENTIIRHSITEAEDSKLSIMTDKYIENPKNAKKYNTVMGYDSEAQNEILNEMRQKIKRQNQKKN